MSARPRFGSDARSDPRIEQLRVPPQSVEAEQAVLGGLMLAPDAYDRIADQLTDHDFYRRDHQLIYRAIRELAEKSRPYDAVTLGEWFESQGLAEQVAGGAYLVELASTTPSAANITAYADIVRDKAVLRQLIDVGTGIVNDSFQPEGRDSGELLAKAEQDVFAIAEAGARGRSDFVPRQQGDGGSLRRAADALRERWRHHRPADRLHRIRRDDRRPAADRPDHRRGAPGDGQDDAGAEHGRVRRDQDQEGGRDLLDGNVGSSQLALRLISSNGRVNATRLRTGQLEDEDWSRVTGAIRMLREAKIFIDDTPALSPDVLRAKARRLKREHDLGLIVIDYLQLMAVPGNSENRATEISEISRSLKSLAKELNVPVVALSQLNRSLETRTDKRPVMADLRESGAIEQDADVIVFIYRDEYYNKDASPDKGLAEIIIGKQRNGPTGSVKLKFFGEYTRFDNLSHDAVGSFE